MIVNDFGQDYGVYCMHIVFKRSLLILFTGQSHDYDEATRGAKGSIEGDCFALDNGIDR